MTGEEEQGGSNEVEIRKQREEKGKTEGREYEKGWAGSIDEYDKKGDEFWKKRKLDMKENYDHKITER